MASSGSIMRMAARIATKRSSSISARNTGNTSSALKSGAGPRKISLSGSSGISSSPGRRYFSEVIAPRKQVSKKERAALRAARREQAATVLQQQKGGAGGDAASAASGVQKQIMASKWVWYLGVGIPVGLLVWGSTDENSPPAKLSEAIGLTEYLQSLSDEYAKPVHDKLLPDWSQMPNVPHDIPVPHTLVLDFENTLVSSTWDRKYGWRHAKRPGVDKFLLDMAQYYEIVLYSPSIETIDPAVASLDKNGCMMHRLYRDATFFQDGVYIKDLKRLNRPINRIIVIDDDLAENAFNPENVIRVKPYDDPTNQTDNTLERITPLLIEIARDGHNDIPGLLSQYQGMDADEIADEHERRIDEFRAMREERMSSGLGGIAKMVRKEYDEAPELEPRRGTFTPPTQQLTSKDLVGAAPSSSSLTGGGGEKSGLMGFLNSYQEDKEENTKRKFEKWNEVMMRKQKEKEEQARQQNS